MGAEKSEGFIIWGAIIDLFCILPLYRWNVWPDIGARGDIRVVTNINRDINTLSFQ